MLAKNPGFAAVAMLSIARRRRRQRGDVQRRRRPGAAARCLWLSAGPDPDDHGHVARHRLPQSQPLAIPSTSMSATSRAASTASWPTRLSPTSYRHRAAKRPRSARSGWPSAATCSTPWACAAARTRLPRRRRPGRAAPSRSWCSTTTSGYGASARTRTSSASTIRIGGMRPHRRSAWPRAASPASITTCTRPSTCRWRCGPRSWPGCRPDELTLARRARRDSWP